MCVIVLLWNIVLEIKGIKYYNNISDKNDNNFFFPAVTQNSEVVCGLISKNGLNHKTAKKYADILRNTL